MKDRKEILLMLCDWFEIVDIDSEMIIIALQNENWQDLEDGLQMQSAIIQPRRGMRKLLSVTKVFSSPKVIPRLIPLNRFTATMTGNR